jgi:hypothetical protein
MLGGPERPRRGQVGVHQCAENLWATSGLAEVTPVGSTVENRVTVVFHDLVDGERLTLPDDLAGTAVVHTIINTMAAVAHLCRG